MFAPRDHNRLPAAPSVKIPTLSSPSGSGAAGSTYAPSLSLRRRFGPSSHTLAAPEVHEVPTAELVVHEYDAPSGMVESPSSSESRLPAPDQRTRNELAQVEDVTALPSTRGDSVDTPTPEFMIQKEEFLEQLVHRVRASCANVITGRETEESGVGRRSRLSPPPRRPSPSSATATSPVVLRTRRAAFDYDDAIGGEEEEEEEVVPRGRAQAPSRSRSPSPQLSHSERGGAPISPLGSPAVLRAGATSPDPRAPSTDFFAAGGALRSSLQHSRCSGVSRGRRSPSTERPEVAAGGCRRAWATADVEATEAAEDNFWARARAARGRRASSLSSEHRGSASTTAPICHPQWAPHPVPKARPAWNQRQPPKKQRPVVSAPGSNPPPPPSAFSSRRSVSRSPERVVESPSAAAHKHVPEAGPQHCAERAFQRSASLPITRQPHRRQRQQQDLSSATVPRCVSPVLATALSPPASGATATAAPATTTSPPSPPSARALFQSADVDSATRTTTPHSANKATAAATLQQVCDAAVARAARAEQQCHVLTLALEQLLVEHAAEKTEWEARFTALETQLRSVTAWVQSVDAEAGITGAKPAALEAMAGAGATTTASPLDSLLPLRGLAGKTVVWDEDEVEGDEDGLHRGSVHGGSSGAPSASSSPFPGAPGATPTPARRGSASGESRGTSACQVRLPPSPPIILHLQSQQ